MPNLDVISLLADESFISYCLGQKDHDTQKWEQFLIENPEQQQQINELKTVIQLTAHNVQEMEWKEQLAVLKQKIQDSYEDSSKVVHIDKPVRKMSVKQWMMAASIIGLLLLGGFTWYYLSRSSDSILPIAFISKPGERKSFQLPDGSTVILNANSQLSLLKGFNHQNRTVHLEGEAYFDVIHNTGKPFIVQTDRMNIKVLGTSFNVRAYKEDATYETALLRGSIELTLKKENKKMMLHPNEKYVLTDIDSSKIISSIPSEHPVASSGLQPLNSLVDDSTVAEVAWVENKLVFTDEPLTEVIKKLERWYGLNIELADASLANILYSGTFRNESIQDVLAGLQFSNHFEFTEQNGKIIIKK